MDDLRIAEYKSTEMQVRVKPASVALLLFGLSSACAASGQPVDTKGAPTAPTARTAPAAPTADTADTATTALTVVTAPTAPKARR
ncbi:MAG: hypothetical protein M3011_05250 [Actinomycetota bacterium]|nr:hypothetical protein [Actinomycetota bacterium]